MKTILSSMTNQNPKARIAISRLSARCPNATTHSNLIGRRRFLLRIVVIVSCALFGAIYVRPSSPVAAENLSNTEMAAQLREAIARFEQGNFEDALAIFSRKEISDTPEALFYRGVLREVGQPGGKPDPRAAAQLYQAAAKKNYAPAQRAFALAQINAKGTLQNFSSAEELLTRASEAGDIESMFLYASLLAEGKIFVLDRKKAFNLWLAAAQKGHADSQTQVGNAYMKGSGIDKNEQTANEWYLKAAQQRHPGAILTLAVNYEQGKGTRRKDLVKAHQFYNLGVFLGVEQGRERLQIVTQELSATDIRKAQEAAKLWVEQYWTEKQ